MNALVFLLIPATIGVDFGWERQPDNSIEYILQIEPEALDSMKTGTELVSSLPPQLRNIRDYRIRVGRDKLPNQNTIPPEMSGVATAQPNIGSNNYATPNNYTTTGNYPPSSTGAYPAGTYPTSNYPNNAYPTGTAANNNYPQNGTGFVNNSTAPGYNPYSGATASSTSGMSPVTGAPAVPTSTSGFPLQTTPANYTTNTTNPTLANLPPPPGTYPNNGYAPNPYPTGTATPSGYNPNGYQPAGYTAGGYNPNGYNNTNPYATNAYAPANNNYANQPYPNQPYQATPNPYAYPQQQYLAMNGGPPPAGYGAAKPSLNDPTGTASNFPQGTQFTPTGTNQLGVPPLTSSFTTNPLSGTNPATQPAGGLTAGNTAPNGQFVNTAGGVDPHSGTNPANGQAAAKEPQSQWMSLAFTMVALFASIGVNIYIFSQNHHLRERCRVLIADRAASY